jgi:hypothetical protein
VTKSISDFPIKLGLQEAKQSVGQTEINALAKGDNKRACLSWSVAEWEEGKQKTSLRI